MRSWLIVTVIFSARRLHRWFFRVRGRHVVQISGNSTEGDLKISPLWCSVLFPFGSAFSLPALFRSLNALALAAAYIFGYVAGTWVESKSPTSNNARNSVYSTNQRGRRAETAGRFLHWFHSSNSKPEKVHCHKEGRFFNLLRSNYRIFVL